MASGFAVDPKLAADCIELGRFEVCRLLLRDDATYPWFVLVPERSDVVELFQLDNDDRVAVMGEITQLSRAVFEAFQADKMNVAALGNLVAQLHIHVIGRKRADPAWPRPVWGVVAGIPYRPDAVEGVRATLLPRLDGFHTS